jgi:hypothetical protein
VIKRVASRHLLPLEIYLGMQMIAWGLWGGLWPGDLHTILAMDGYKQKEWLTVLVVVGTVQIGWSALEWLFGRHWPLWEGTEARLSEVAQRGDAHPHWPPTVHLSVSVRACVAFVAGSVWIYVCLALVAVPAMHYLGVLAIIAPGSFCFCAWTFVENLKVRYALDPRIPTSTLRFDR